uniref:Uncharacterized protein n=1 Tax=Arundo donax TaxID=35708 RepID=A0A0A8YJV2_ARUDO
MQPLLCMILLRKRESRWCRASTQILMVDHSQPPSASAPSCECPSIACLPDCSIWFL